MGNNTDLVIKAFEILKIKIPKEKKIGNMLEQLKNISNSPVMSKSEIDVHARIRELIEAIEQKRSREQIEQVLQRLMDEVNYCEYWD